MHAKHGLGMCGTVCGTYRVRCVWCVVIGWVGRLVMERRFVCGAVVHVLCDLLEPKAYTYACAYANLFTNS